MDNHTTVELPEAVRIGLLTYSILLLTFGTIGNILLLATLFYKNLRRHLPEPNTETTQTCVQRLTSKTARTTAPRAKARGATPNTSVADKLLTWLTISDLLCLWVLVLRYTISLAIDWELRSVSQFACLFHTYLSMSLSNLSIALLCIFCVHRTISIVWPFAMHTWLTRRSLNLCLIVAVLAILAKHIPVFLVFSLIPTGTQNKCDTTGQRPILEVGYVYFEFITHTVIGYTILIVSNICLCVALRRRRTPGAQSVSTSSREGNRELSSSASHGCTNIAYVLLLFSVLQLVTSVPFFIVIELSLYFDVQLVPESNRLMAYFALLLLMLTNNAINYYVMVGISSKFRSEAREFLVFLGSLCSCRKIKTEDFDAETSNAC